MFLIEANKPNVEIKPFLLLVRLAGDNENIIQKKQDNCLKIKRK